MTAPTAMGRLLKVAAIAALCGVLAVALLLVTMWREHTTVVTLPVPTGSSPIGRTTFVWNNAISHEELAVWIWYPASGSTQPTADYLPSTWRDGLRANQGVLMRSFFKRDPRVVRTHSRSHAAVSAERPTYPVVLLRPGGSALTVDFTILAEDLASHGYVVVGFDSPRRSVVFVGSDGRVISRARANTVDNAGSNLADPEIGRLLQLWTSDSKAVIDHLQRLNAAVDGMFAGRLDLGRVGAVGHSFGGATALQWCHDDSRCRAAVDLDGIPFGTVATEGLRRPAMFLLSDHSREADAERHKVLSVIESIYQRLPRPRVYATVQKADHFSFSDQILLNSRAAITLFRLSGLAGSLSGERGLAISENHVRTFFDVTLMGVRQGVLRQLTGRFPEVSGDYDVAMTTGTDY